MDELYKKFEKQLVAFKIADSKKYETAEDLQLLEETYDTYNQKLDFIKMIDTADDQTKKRAYSVIGKIMTSNLSEKRQLLMSISYAVLINYFTKINEHSDDELFMLSACSMDLDLDDYTFYVGILSNPQVSKSIMDKTSCLKDQVNIAYQVMDTQDDLGFDMITSQNNLVLVNHALKVIKDYDPAITKH